MEKSEQRTVNVRVLSGIGIGVCLFIVLYFGGYVLSGALLVLSMIAYTEIVTVCGIVEDKKINAIVVAGYAGICVHYYFLMWQGDLKLFPLSIIGTFLVMLLLYVICYPRYHAGVVMIAIFAFLYAPVMLSFIYLIRVMEHGAFLAWLPFVAWVSDTCAYLTGMRFGRHKMAKRLSPKKSWEGAAGGALGSVIAGVMYGLIASAAVIKDYRVVWIFAVIAFFASVLSQIGDLVASGIKRDHKIKDYGHLIPGHGGIMDRFDSVIFICPLIYCLAVVLV